jgi:hypothetical protein
MPVSFGDIFALLGEVRALLEKKGGSAKKDRLLRVRKALRSLYFSKETVEALKSMSSEDFSKVTVRYSDSIAEVDHAIMTLKYFLRDEGMSLAAENAIHQIEYFKWTQRQHIVEHLFDLSQGKERSVGELLEGIDKLNKMIVELDSSLDEMFLG